MKIDRTNFIKFEKDEIGLIILKNKNIDIYQDLFQCVGETEFKKGQYVEFNYNGVVMNYAFFKLEDVELITLFNSHSKYFDRSYNYLNHPSEDDFDLIKKIILENLPPRISDLKFITEYDDYQEAFIKCSFIDNEDSVKRNGIIIWENSD